MTEFIKLGSGAIYRLVVITALLQLQIIIHRWRLAAVEEKLPRHDPICVPNESDQRGFATTALPTTFVLSDDFRCEEFGHKAPVSLFDCPMPSNREVKYCPHLLNKLWIHTLVPFL